MGQEWPCQSRSLLEMHAAVVEFLQLKMSDFQKMLSVIRPTRDNSFINDRNAAAHCVTLRQVQEAVKDLSLVLWTNALASGVTDASMPLHHIAFQKSCNAQAGERLDTILLRHNDRPLCAMLMQRPSIVRRTQSKD
jgi:hypothetical protein